MVLNSCIRGERIVGPDNAGVFEIGMNKGGHVVWLPELTT